MIPLPFDAAGLEGTTRFLYHPRQPAVSPDAPGSGRDFRANTGHDPGNMGSSPIRIHQDSQWQQDDR